MFFFPRYSMRNILKDVWIDRDGKEPILLKRIAEGMVFPATNFKLRKGATAPQHHYYTLVAPGIL